MDAWYHFVVLIPGRKQIGCKFVASCCKTFCEHQRCVDPKILSPHQSMDFDQRSASTEVMQSWIRSQSVSAVYVPILPPSDTSDTMCLLILLTTFLLVKGVTNEPTMQTTLRVISL